MNETETAETATDGLTAYEAGFRDGKNEWRGFCIALSLVFAFYVLAIGFNARETIRRTGYRQGQIDAAQGVQHFYAVRQEISASTVTEWFDDRETQTTKR